MRIKEKLNLPPRSLSDEYGLSDLSFVSEVDPHPPLESLLDSLVLSIDGLQISSVEPECDGVNPLSIKKMQSHEFKVYSIMNKKSETNRRTLRAWE